MIEISMPIRLGRGQNDRGHWAMTYRRAKKQKNDALWSLLTLRDKPSLPCMVTIVRVASKADTHPLDDDNLVGSAKHVRDAIAHWLGVDDGDPRVQYRYAQRKGAYSVDVRFEDA